MAKRFNTKGITRRWLVNVLALITVCIVVVEIIISIFIYRYYANSAKDAASVYSQSFTMLSTASETNFFEQARWYIEEFEHKDKVEIQIIDQGGNVVLTTNGFEPVSENKPDYIAALKSETATATWQGRQANGESVMAGTTILSDLGSGSNGAVRWVVSMRRINRHVAVLISAAVAVGLGILMFTAFSGLYFIKSIVKPVQEVGNIARKIAMGDFEARLDVREHDEIGELCETINYMANELRLADNVKNDFISSVSHELRTPLTAIRGWGETVQLSVGADDELVRKGVEVILSEADRLSGLVEELLDFSRLQSGRMTMHLEQTDVLSCLLQAVNMYHEVAKKRNIELSFMEPKSLPPIVGDANRLKQVFINIIDNSIKYTQDNGQVLVAAYPEEGCIRITVSDTGVGIPVADIDHVKEKFFKSNKNVSGSGIGLAVADEIIKQHNGLLFLESKENVGTTVTIVLPVAPSTMQIGKPEGEKSNGK